MNKIDNTFAPTSTNKGFKMKDIKDLDAMVIFKRQIEFKELINLEK